MRFWVTLWLAVLSMLVVTGCGSSGDESQPAEADTTASPADDTTTSSTAEAEPSSTTEAEPTSSATESTLSEEANTPPRQALEPSLDAFTGRWNQTVEILVEENPSASPLVVTAADFVTGRAGDGSELFIAEVGEGALLGGTIDPRTGAVTTVMYAGGSDGGDGGTVLLATSAVLSLDDENFADIAETTTAVRDGSPGDTAYLAGPTKDYVVTLTPVTDAGPPVVVTFAAGTTDEATAQAHAATILPELLALLG